MSSSDNDHLKDRALTGDDGGEDPAASDSHERYEKMTAEDLRQGRIVLTTPLRRWLFFGALGLIAVAAIFGMVLR